LNKENQQSTKQVVTKIQDREIKREEIKNECLGCDNPIVLQEFGKFSLKLSEEGNKSIECSESDLVSSASMKYKLECYKRQSENYRFSDQPLKQIDVKTYGNGKQNSSRAVMVVMCASSQMSINDLRALLPMIERQVSRKHAYDLAIFHEDFSTDLMDELASHIKSSKLHFVKIEFSIPKNLQIVSKFAPRLMAHFTNNAQAEPIPYFHTHLHGLLLYNKRKNLGYYHMCRFYAGAGLMLPFFDKYDWMLRFDTDMEIQNPMVDYMEEFETAGKQYGFYQDFLDGGDFVEDL
jgi:hypothetical protein